MPSIKNRAFCPILKDDCRRDCQWCDVVTELDDNGCNEELVCAIANIAAFAMAPYIDEDGWAYDD